MSIYEVTTPMTRRYLMSKTKAELCDVIDMVLKTQGFREKLLADAGEMLWVVVANASGGDWSKQTEEWQQAARRWADNYHETIKGLGVPRDEAPKVQQVGNRAEVVE